MGMYNPQTKEAYRVGSIPGIAGQNGDFAFTADGQLILVANTNVYTVEGEIPSTAGNVTLNLSDLIATLPGGAQGNGIAFAMSGNIFVSSASTLFEIDLVSGETVNQYANPTGASFTDLASCSYPNTILLEKTFSQTATLQRTSLGSKLMPLVEKTDLSFWERLKPLESNPVCKPSVRGHTSSVMERHSTFPNLRSITPTWITTTQESSVSTPQIITHPLTSPERGPTGRSSSQTTSGARA